MRVRPGLMDRPSCRGFSLIELLLTVVLILLFLGAMVFNFGSLQKGVALDQGAEQVEALLRFARAHAAATGKKVQIWFEEDAGDGLRIPLGNLQLMWEPDPLGNPGAYEIVMEAKPYIERILELVAVDDVAVNPDDGGGDTLEDAAPEIPAETGAEETMMVTFPPITFFPDGVSDAAQIILSSRDEEDERQMMVRLEGIAGITRREFLLAPELITDEEGSTNGAAISMLP